MMKIHLQMKKKETTVVEDAIEEPVVESNEEVSTEEAKESEEEISSEQVEENKEE